MSLGLLEKDPGLGWTETQLPMGGEGDEKGGGLGDHGSRPMGGEGWWRWGRKGRGVIRCKRKLQRGIERERERRRRKEGEGKEKTVGEESVNGELLKRSRHFLRSCSK